MDHEQFGTTEKYRIAFQRLSEEGISEKHRALLQAHFNAADHTATWGQLAKRAGYKNGLAVNMEYGKLAGRVAQQLGIDEKPEGFWLYVLAGWAKARDSATRHTAFVLRRPVIEALTQLGMLMSKPVELLANERALAKLCIYTIKHSEDLRATIGKGGSDIYTKRKRWVRAASLLSDAKRDGQRLAIVFAPAEATRFLFGWALLDEVSVGVKSKYSFSELREFHPRPLKTTLRKARNGKPLHKSFIRPYAICLTPRSLDLSVV